MTALVFTGVRAQWGPLYEALLKQAEQALPEFKVREVSGVLVWEHNSSFASVSANRDGLLITVAADQLHPEWQPLKVEHTSANRFSHRLQITNPDQFGELLDRLAAAYSLTHTPGRRSPARPSEQPPAGSIDDYLAQFSGIQRQRLEEVRTIIAAAVPEAEERISWQMPTFRQGHNLIQFAGFAQHYSVFPGPAAIAEVAPQLQTLGLKTSKGTIQFPYDQPVPADLIVQLVEYAVEHRGP